MEQLQKQTTTTAERPVTRPSADRPLPSRRWMGYLVAFVVVFVFTTLPSVLGGWGLVFDTAILATTASLLLGSLRRRSHLDR